MNIDKKKFNKDLMSRFGLFCYIEEEVIVKTKSAGNILFISFGAFNHLGHLAPEFG